MRMRRTPRLVFLAAIFLTVVSIADVGMAAQKINGEMTETGGIAVLRVWGTAYQMGFAEGTFLASKMKLLVTDYILPTIPPIAWEAARLAYPLLFENSPRIAEEIQGFVDGAKATGADLFIDQLGREMDALDFETANALADLSSAAYLPTGLCSSFSAYGDATADSDLGGDLAIVRNLDWGGGANDPFVLSRNTMLLVRIPAEERYQPTLTVNYPGFFGCLSCINEAGIEAEVNQGNNRPPFTDVLTKRPFMPVCYAMREGIEAADVDGDGRSTGADVIAALQQHFFGSILVHIVEPQSLEEIPAKVVELQTEAGWVVRYPADDPDIGPWRLGVTNTHEKLFPPQDCWRYDIMREQVEERNGLFDTASLWNLMNLVAFRDLTTGGFTNLTYFYNPDSGAFGLAKTDDEGFSVDKQPVWFTLSDLFHPAGADDDTEPLDDTQPGHDDTLPDNQAASSDDDSGENGSGCGC